MYTIPFQVINGYAVPEPFWIVGRWDTTACAAMDNGCGSAMEVAEVICSRGSDLLCSGAWVASDGVCGRLTQNDRSIRLPRA